MDVINTLGRRKTAVARVYLSKGTGNIIVNRKDYKVAFPIDILQAKINQPFAATDTLGQYDVKINVECGCVCIS
jgi:small subunit ribosomal protein S9